MRGARKACASVRLGDYIKQRGHKHSKAWSQHVQPSAPVEGGGAALHPLLHQLLRCDARIGGADRLVGLLQTNSRAV